MKVAEVMTFKVWKHVENSVFSIWHNVSAVVLTHKHTHDHYNTKHGTIQMPYCLRIY
jgi:hypothetical protein